MKGTIESILTDKGFGFIRPDGTPRGTYGKGVFFHVRDLLPPLEFGEQLLELDVEFDIEQQLKGPRARNVRSSR